jgi:DNA-binding transcriptional regulator YiaG
MMLSAAAIRATREQLGENQAKFAKRFGVNQCTISRWETEGLPTKGVAKLIERAIRELRGQ